MNTTWSFLLLFLSTITGRETKFEVKGCREGWFEFTCEYPKGNGKYTSVTVHAKNKLIRSTKKDMWVYEGRFSLYHDTENKNFRVAIKQLRSLDDGRYWCEFYQGSRPHRSTKELELEVDEDCQSPFTHTAYKSATTTITCDFPENTYDFSIKFFCKENHSTCEDILPTKYSLNSMKPKVTLTETNSGFNISITNVSPQHAGVYWCGVESNERRYRAALKKIQLQVEDISNSTKSLTTGQTFTYQCVYPNNVSIKKILCKGEDPSICEPLANSLQREKKIKRFSIEDNKKGEITITMRQLTTEDSGTYWCGAQITDKPKSNPFFHKLVMTVAGGSWLSVIIPVVVCVALLMLILVSVYKRFQRTKNTRKAEAQNNKDPAYEEIQEHPQKPGSGTALKSIYVTANAPTNPSASQYYSTVNFNSSSGEVSGDTYSTVRDNQQFPTYSTVNHPSRLPEDSFYSTVNNPQQH